MKNKRQNLNSGFVALFTVLIASIILAMAVGIANISLKQIVLSGSATDANKSFYVADSGVECALYNDIRVHAFDIDLPASSISCGGTSVNLDPQVQVGLWSFSLDFNDSGPACAKVTVDKTDPDIKKIISKGTNAQCDVPTSRTVERVIEVTY